MEAVPMASVLLPLSPGLPVRHQSCERPESLTQVHVENDDENGCCGGACYEDWL